MKKVADIDVYTLEEIAEQMECTIESMRKYVKEGRLKSQKIGGRYYCTRDAVKAFIENRDLIESADLMIEKAVKAKLHELSGK